MRFDLENLPSDTALLHRLVREMADVVESRDGEIERLQIIIKKLQRAQFGRRSERLDADQLALALEDLDGDIARIREGRPAIATEAADAPVGPAAKRAAAAHLQAKLGLPERRTCSIVGANRTMIRYRSRKPADSELRARLRELASERRRFGYRRLFVLLRRRRAVRPQPHREEGFAVAGVAVAAKPAASACRSWWRRSRMGAGRSPQSEIAITPNADKMRCAGA